MVRIDDERSISQEMDAKLSQCVLHGNDLLVLHWVIAFGWLQMTPLIADDALRAVCVILHQRTADCVIAGVTDHMEWSVLIYNRQDGQLRNALLENFKGTLTVSVP